MATASPTRFADYTAVAGQPAKVLRALLAEGDGAERVWAAWALALRLGRRAVRTLREAARSAPEPGVRRQLTVVLAGFHEVDAVAQLAQSDRDGAVRATASRYLVRLAAGRPELWPLAASRLADRDPRVREALIEELGPAAPDQVVAAALARRADRSLDVRRAVLELAARLAEGAGRLPAAVRDRAARERDPELRRRWHQLWLGHHGAAGLVAEVASAGDLAIVGEALDAIAAAGVPVRWADVEPAAGLAGGPVGHRLVGLFEGRLDDIPLAALLAYLHGVGRHEACAWPYASHLSERLRALRAGELSASELAALADLGADAHRMEDALSDTSWLEDEVSDEEIWQTETTWREEIAELAAACDRLTAHS